MPRPTVTLAAFLFAAPVAARAQSHPLVGKWNVEWAGGMRVENGEVSYITLTGTLAVAEQGDSVVATLTVAPQEGMPARPPLRLATRKADGPLHFQQLATVRINENGSESTRQARIDWSLNAAGDVLDGTITRNVEGDLGHGSEPQPVKGTRAKGE